MAAPSFSPRGEETSYVQFSSVSLRLKYSPLTSASFALLPFAIVTDPYILPLDEDH